MQEWAGQGGRLEQGRTEVTAARSRPARPRRVSFFFPDTVVVRRGLLFTSLVDALGRLSLGTLLSMWTLTVIGCGVLFWAAGFLHQPALLAAGEPLSLDAHGLVTAIYFSFVTAASIGYGDVVPVGWVRLIAIGEGISALFIFGLLVSKFVSRRQDELIGEIHRTTFEDRLDRVRTSLHLVLTEIDSIAETCQERGWPRERLLVRVESAAVVFVGELRAVHDLLYRPQQVPEEEVLEGIIAGLASGLQAFVELFGHVPEANGRSAALERSLNSMATLAREICGECVPRAYAPDLKAWMDRVQQLAAALTAAGSSRPAGT